MKKTLIALTILAIGAPAAFALDPVELQEGCIESFGDYGMDAEGMLWVGLLQALELSEAEGASWNMPLLGPALDSESLSMEEFFVGDGIPDNFQTSLLAAVICSAAKDAAAVAAQFDANKALYAGFLADLDAFLVAIGDGTDDKLAEHMMAVGDMMIAVGTALSQPDLVEFGMLLSCDGTGDCIIEGEGEPEIIIGFGNQLAEFIGDLIDQLLVPTLGAVSNVFSAQVGMSSEGALTGNLLLYSLLEELQGIDLLLEYEVAANLDDTALLIQGMLAGMCPDPPGPPYTGVPTCEEAYAMTLAMQALADEIAVVVGLMHALAETNPLDPEEFTAHTPDFVIYGVEVAKTAGEPFSAFGDFDGDGLSNLETYQNLQGAGMDSVQEFIAAASGSELWYPGSPALPVAGFLGLALLAGGAAVGGALAIRKK